MIDFAEDGAPDGPALVCAHALGTDRSIWSSLVAHLRDRYRIVTYDARGHGASDAPRAPTWPLEVFAEDLLDLMDRLAIDSAHFVGISMGAVTGLAAVDRYPQRFASLVLCGANLHTEPAFTADLEQRATAALAEGLAAVAPPMVARWYECVRDPQAEARLIERFMKMAPRAYSLCAGGLARYDLRPALGRVRQPVLLVAGEHDRSRVAAYRALAAGNVGNVGSGGSGYNRTCAVITGAAHLPNLQAPERFNRVVTEFIETAFTGTSGKR